MLIFPAEALASTQQNDHFTMLVYWAYAHYIQPVARTIFLAVNAPRVTYHGELPPQVPEELVRRDAVNSVLSSRLRYHWSATFHGEP